MTNATNTAKLSLQGNYAEKVLSYYLWGQENAPKSNEIVDEKYANRSENLTMETTNQYAEKITVNVGYILQIDAQEYMNTVGGFNAADVGIFQKFFNNVQCETDKQTGEEKLQPFTLDDIKEVGGNLSPDGKTISLTHQQLVDIIYEKPDKDDPKAKDSKYYEALQGQKGVSQYDTDIGENNYWQRAFVFGSTRFQIDTDNIRYVFDAETGKALEIQNLQVKPVNDNFDFESKDGTAGQINPILKQMMDPSGIGKTVGFEFTNNKFFTVNSETFTADDFKNYESRGLVGKAIDEVQQAWYFNQGLKELDKSGVYDFRNEEDKVVIFGSKQSDNLAGYTTDYEYQLGKKVQLDKDIDVSSIGGWYNPVNWFADGKTDNAFLPYLKNGIVYVGGNGSDNITGTDYNDRLIGGNGHDFLVGEGGDDHLDGGDGNDAYYIKDNDTISDSDGKGHIYFNSRPLGNFRQDANTKTLWHEFNDKGEKTGITAVRQGDNLFISDNNENSVNIENFFTHADELANGGFKGLSIILPNEDKTQPETNDYLLWAGDIRPEVDDNGKYKVNWLDHSQRNANGEIINGTPQKGFNDVIVGQAGKSNKIYGLDGNDALHGRDQDDLIDGGHGDDLIAGGGGKDTIYGGSGNDYIFSNWTLEMRLRNSDDDQWTVRDNRYLGTVTQGSTWGVYSIGNNQFIVDHESKNRTYHNDADKQGDTLYGGSGNDIVVGGNNNDILYGDEIEDEHDTRVTQDGDDSLFGMGGDDLIYGNGGNDLIYGDGVTFVDLQYCPTEEHGNDTVFAGDGDDTVYGNGGDDVILGGDGNDKLYGDFDNGTESKQFADVNGDDVIDGGNGSDQIAGGGGDDSIVGGSGDDIVVGDYYHKEFSHISGNDYIDGGNGDDNLYGSGGDDYIIGGDGDDWIGGDFNNLPEVAEFADNNGNDTIDGGNGNDTIHGGGGDDNIFGGDGDDNVYGDYGHSELSHISGNDTIDGGNGNDEILGCGGDDTILGGAGNDHIFGDYSANNQPTVQNSGNDYIDGQDGDDDLLGGDGDDIILGGNGDDILTGDMGDEEKFAHIKGNDYLDGGNGNDTIFGNDGDDILIAGRGNDKLLGGKGEDTYLFNKEDLQNEDVEYNVIWDEDGKGAIVVDGVYLHKQDWVATAENRWETDNMRLEKTEIDSHTFLIWQSKETNALIGVQDYQDGDLGFELLPFDPNNDNPPTNPESNHAPVVNEILTEQTLKVNQEWSFVLPETLFTDPDGDKLTYSIENLPEWLHFDPQTNTLTGTASHTGVTELTITATDPSGDTAQMTLTLNAYHSISGTNQNDTINGTDDNDLIYGGKGNDTIYGKLGNDYINGSVGNDKLYGEDGDDRIIGGAGNDYIDGGNGNDRISGSDGDDEIHGKAGDDRLSGSNGNDVIYGEDGEDIISGGIGDDILYGGTGNDRLSGNDGDDTIYGEDGNDTLYGGLGDDTLYGDAGDDHISGGEGNDTVYGGEGDDQLVGFYGDDTLIGGMGNDTLNGGLGNDTYQFNGDFGQDTIKNYDTDKERLDRIHFTDRNIDDLLFSQNGSNLIIQDKNGDNQLTVQSYFNKNGNYRIDEIEFKDGTALNISQINDMIADTKSTSQSAIHSDNASDDNGSWYNPLNWFSQLAQWIGLSHKDKDMDIDNLQNTEQVDKSIDENFKALEMHTQETAETKSANNEMLAGKEMAEENTDDFNEELYYADIMPDWRYEEQEDKDDDWLM